MSGPDAAARGERVGVGRAPGKVILAGEHFVVHGAPAIALPVRAVGKRVTVTLAPPATNGDATPAIEVEDAHGEREHLLAMMARAVELLDVRNVGRLRLVVDSTLAPGAHLGSSASLAVALLRALAAATDASLPEDRLCQAALELERIVHGNPSGIDPTVVALDRPIWFRKGAPVEPIAIDTRAELLLADTGVASSTAAIVARVGRFRTESPDRFAAARAHAEDVARRLRAALARDDGRAAGACLDENQALLVEIGTSAPAVDRLVDAARAAGALGAKLTGAGGGGNVLALVAPAAADRVREALEAAGARRVLQVPLPFGGMGEG